MTEETKEVEKVEVSENKTPSNDANLMDLFSGKEAEKFAKQQELFFRDIRQMVPRDLLRKENPTDEDKAEIKKHIENYIRLQYLKRYNLDKVDLDKEYEKIKEKHSGLSRSQRDAVVGYFLIFKFGPVVQEKLNELEKKENRTPEEEELLKAILGTKQLEDAYNAVKNAETKTEQVENTTETKDE